jgi:hypothetical protein
MGNYFLVGLEVAQSKSGWKMLALKYLNTLVSLEMEMPLYLFNSSGQVLLMDMAMAHAIIVIVPFQV